MGMTYPFTTDEKMNNSICPEFIASELSHANGRRSGCLLSVRKVSARGDIRWVFEMENGRRVLRIKTNLNRSINVYENEQDIGK